MKNVSKKILKVASEFAIVATVLAIVPFASSDSASATASVAICSNNQIRAAVESDSGAYSAAGNHGVAIAVINVSHTICSLDGYPKLQVYPSKYNDKSVKVTDNGGGQIFSAVKPRPIVIEPGASASFGLNYGDAYNQGDPRGGACMTQSITARFPVRGHPYSVPFTLPLELNFCFANFHFGVTSVQQGPLPRVS